MQYAFNNDPDGDLFLYSDDPDSDTWTVEVDYLDKAGWETVSSSHATYFPALDWRTPRNAWYVGFGSKIRITEADGHVVEVDTFGFPAGRMTPAAERVVRIIDSGWATYPDDLPMILMAMTDEDQRDHLIIERETRGWPGYAQVVGYRDDMERMLHAEIQHPSITVKEGETEPELPQAILDALHADGWQDPKEDYSPNFWIEVSTQDASVLTDKIMSALLTNMSPEEVTSLSIQAWGPAFGPSERTRGQVTQQTQPSGDKPVLVERPADWDQMSDDEKHAWAAGVATDMGVPSAPPTPT